jgi:lipoyl-dependent peroxiredoxin
VIARQCRQHEREYERTGRAEVDVGPTEAAYGIVARLNVHLPGIEQGVTERLLEAAYKLCPCSRAKHGNIDLTTTLV